MDFEFLNDPALWLLITFVVPLMFRVPIAISLGLSALLVGWWWDMGVDMLSYNFFAGIAKVPLLAIPFFILAGFIMERAGIAARIVPHCIHKIIYDEDLLLKGLGILYQKNKR